LPVLYSESHIFCFADGLPHLFKMAELSLRIKPDSNLPVAGEKKGRFKCVSARSMDEQRAD